MPRKRRLGVWLWLAVAAAGLVVAAGAWGGEAPLPGHAVIYARSRVQRQPDGATPSVWVVYWQMGSDPSEARVLYTSTPGYRPGRFGYLPSPDGRWLHIWDTSDLDLQHPKTQWLVVAVPGGRRLPIGERSGTVGLFPRWLDDDRLQLARGDQSAVFDVRTGKLTNPLPPPQALPELPQYGERDIDSSQPAAAAWRRAYLERYYARDEKLLEVMEKEHEDELAVSPYLRLAASPGPETLESFLLRPLGILNLSGFMGNKTIWPCVAISPDGTLLARTAFVVTGRKERTTLGGSPYLGYTFDARLDLYALPSAKHLWGRVVPQSLPQSHDAALYLRHGGLSSVFEPWFTNPRWSSDGRYLCFATLEAWSGRAEVSVLDTTNWRVVLRMPDAGDAFVVPAGGATER